VLFPHREVLRINASTNKRDRGASPSENGTVGFGCPGHDSSWKKSRESVRRSELAAAVALFIVGFQKPFEADDEKKPRRQPKVEY
jgi:hypothetical protein